VLQTRFFFRGGSAIYDPRTGTVLKDFCRVLKSKHTEDESINIRGDFRPVYYFLYEDGDLEEVNLQEYMTFEPKDTLCIKYQIEK
jgi:hypothetical protein